MKGVRPDPSLTLYGRIPKGQRELPISLGPTDRGNRPRRLLSFCGSRLHASGAVGGPDPSASGLKGPRRGRRESGGGGAESAGGRRSGVGPVTARDLELGEVAPSLYFLCARLWPARRQQDRLWGVRAAFRRPLRVLSRWSPVKVSKRAGVGDRCACLMEEPIRS